MATWLADCATTTRCFFGSCKLPSRNFRRIRHCIWTIFRSGTWIYSREDTSTVVRLGCQSSPLVCCACPFKRTCLWTTLAWMARSTSTSFTEACFNTVTSPTAIQFYPQHRWLIFGRPINDFIPILPGWYWRHNSWIETSLAREAAMRARNVRNAERLFEHTVRLQHLKVGDRVYIQYQTGNHHCDGIEPTLWSTWNSSTNTLSE